MDELLIRVLTRLLRVHDEFGEAGFQDAAHRALVAIALTAKCKADLSGPLAKSSQSRKPT